MTVTRCLLELANVFAAVVLLWSVRMSYRHKAAVLAAFLLRLLFVPSHLTHNSLDFTSLHFTSERGKPKK